MNDTSWYFQSLSTIAQVLASILGLAAIFAVLRLEGILKELREMKILATRMLDIRFQYFPNTQTSPTRKSSTDVLLGLRDMDKHYSEEFSKKPAYSSSIIGLRQIYAPDKQYDSPNFIKDTLNQLEFLVSSRDEARKYIRKPALLGAMVIVLAILFLGLGNSVYCKGAVLLTIGILAMWSLWEILWASWKLWEASAD